MEEARTEDTPTIVTLAFVYGFIHTHVEQSGRTALETVCPHGRDKLKAEGASEEQRTAADEQRPWDLTYEGGDTAELTWGDTGRRQRVPVPREGQEVSESDMSQRILDAAAEPAAAAA